MSNGGLALIRLAAALLVLVLASPARALPVSYDFVATPTGGDGSLYFGAFTLDADYPDQAPVITAFVAPWWPHEGLVDWAHLPEWPTDPDAFPVVSGGASLYTPPSLVGAELWTGLGYYDLSYSPYDFGCEPGTPILDCPGGTFRAVGSYVHYDVQVTPEPSAAATLLIAATALLIWKRYGQLPSVPSSQASAQVEHFGPEGGA